MECTIELTSRSATGKPDIERDRRHSSVHRYQSVNEFVHYRDQGPGRLIEVVTRRLSLGCLCEFADSRQIRVVGLKHRVETKARFELFDADAHVPDAVFEFDLGLLDLLRGHSHGRLLANSVRLFSGFDSLCDSSKQEKELAENLNLAGNLLAAGSYFGLLFLGVRSRRPRAAVWSAAFACLRRRKN